MEFSTRAMKRIVKSQGSKRVSEDAAEELGDILEAFAGDIAEEALVIACNQGRKTVKKSDVKKALS
ncbi:MAG: histone [Candidatus Nanohaloarchaea archaeon]